jgi:hypothetical protein
MDRVLSPKAFKPRDNLKFKNSRDVESGVLSLLSSY